MKTLCAILLPLGFLLLPGLALAQDRDHDGLPDSVEAQLGTNPDLDEGLQLIIDDKTRGQGDNNIGKGPDAPDVDKVYFAHVGGNRYVWKITFAKDYPASGTIFHLYCDVDDNKATGRQDGDWVRGCDIMYSFVDAKFDPRIIEPAVRLSAGIPPRGIVQGNAIYVCDDLKMNVVGGKTRFRMFILSHMKDKPADSDTTDWVTVEAPLHPERALPKLPYPVTEGFERITMPDFAQLAYDVWQDKRTVRLQAKDATVSGYTLLMSDDFDGAGQQGETVAWKSPVAGSYLIGLILHEQASRAAGLEVLAGGNRVGTVSGLSSRQRDVLWYSSAPVALQAGETIEVRTAENSGPLRFQSVCLLGDKPKIPPLVIENLTSWHMPDEPGVRRGRIMIAWTTNRPTDGAVGYSLAGPEAMVQNGVLKEDRGAVNNHFIILPPELRSMGYKLEVTCKEPPQEDYAAETATARYTVWRNAEQQAAREGRSLAVAKPVRIALTVHEPTGQSRSAWPVSSGVPLPDGLLKDPWDCRLLDASGKRVWAQFKALAWWPGGVYVKWLLVDFLADTKAGQDSQYVLECPVLAGPLPPESDIGLGLVEIVRADATGRIIGDRPVTLRAYSLDLKIDPTGFAPFAHVTLGGRPVSVGDPKRAGFEITDDKGTVYSSALAPPEQITVEENGPVRATLCVKGKLVSAGGGDFMRYVCRMHFYAGKPTVRVVFSLDNDITKPEMSEFRNVQVRVPAELHGAAVTVGADGAAMPLQAGEALLQDDDSHFATGQHQGKRADGWLLAESPGRSLAVSVRDFWQLYPKGLSADDTGVTLGLLPALPEKQYAGASDDDLTKLYYWCDKGRYKVRVGVRLTSEFAVDFAPAAAEKGATYAAAQLWQSPLFAACTPEWYCKSGALGELNPRQAGKFEVYEKNLDTAFGRFLERREKIREYGFMNYGDWFGERTWNWGNSEYDTQWALAANFARTGNLAMLWRAEQMERHNGDVDVSHYWPTPGEVGAVFEHCVGHTGGYFPDNWKDMGGFNRGGRDTGHVWCQGHFTLYALTGEPRFLETSEAVARWISNLSTDFHYYCERGVGWPITGLMGGYNVTGNPVYLNAAKLMADNALWTLNPDRGEWGHFQDPSECKHTPHCWGCKPFMTGVLLHGLKLYDLAQPRADIKEVFRRNSDFLWRVAYIPQDNGFIYSECKTFSSKGQNWTISLVGDGLAYGCMVDPAHAHKDLLETATAGFMYQAGFSEFGKSFTQGACFMPTMLHDLDALGLSKISAPPAPPGKQKTELRDKVFLAAGEERTIRPVIHHGEAKAADCRMSFPGARADWFALPGPSVTWQTAPGISFGPEITVRAPADAPEGATQTLAVRLERSGAAEVVRVVATVVALAKLGQEIGWISGEGDPLRLAAEALGIKPTQIADAATADLSQFKTIIVGDEGYFKNFGNVQTAASKLERWVASGGRLIVGQLQDDGWETRMLPSDLGLSDADDVSARAGDAQHPLFNTPEKVGDLSGIKSYDSMTYSDPAWKVLARNAGGGPAIIEGRVGAGTVLAIMPSFDRPVAGLEKENAEKLELCTKFMRNLLAYAGYAVAGK